MEDKEKTEVIIKTTENLGIEVEVKNVKEDEFFEMFKVFTAEINKK